MRINFQAVLSTIDLKKTEVLAIEIWKDHYTPIIGEDQVSYMLDKFQSVDAMSDQIDLGYHYFLINNDEVPIGYLSYEKREEHLFLSKIYVLKNFRGKGIGKLAMKFVMERAKAIGCKKIGLTVNKYNHDSIKAYEKIGFVNIKALVQDIGGGFIMDDYFMEFSL